MPTLPLWEQILTAVEDIICDELFPGLSITMSVKALLKGRYLYIPLSVYMFIYI